VKNSRARGKPAALLAPVRRDIPIFRKIARDFGIQQD